MECSTVLCSVAGFSVTPYDLCLRFFVRGLGHATDELDESVSFSCLLSPPPP